MPRSTYDAIVLGSDFAGLVTATLCARRGLRVLLASRSQRLASYQLGPYRLPIEPLVVPGLTSPAIRHVLDELHFHHVLKRRLRSGQPAFQFVAPDARIDVDADEGPLGRELSRELGDASPLGRCETAASVARGLDALLDEAHGHAGFFERREQARNAKKLDDEARAWDAQVTGAVERALFTLPAALAGHASADSLSPSARARGFDAFRQGAPRLGGDWESLYEIFLDKFASHGGEVRVVDPAALSTSWGKITGLTLRDGEELGASQVVLAEPVGEALDLCEGKVARRLTELADTIELAGYRYTLNLVVDAIGVPEGMAQSVLAVVDPAAPLEGDNAFAIHLGEPDSHARVPVTVQTTCPLPPGDLDGALANLRVGLRERLELVMPFLSEHVRVAHSPHEYAPPEGLGEEVELARLCPPRPLWRFRGDTALGLVVLPEASGVKNLVLASSQMRPALGLEGDFATGHAAAGLVCDALGKKRDLLKHEILSESR